MIITDKITYDAVTKKATIMRDGEYLYLAGELGMSGRDPFEPIRVFRPAEEVEKAYMRFNELKRIPVTKDHPEMFLDLALEDSFVNGEAKNPDLNKKDSLTVLDCDMIMKEEALLDYQNGTKELSCGWQGDFEPVEKEGLGYSFIQRFIDINHVALVSAGRCGRVCSVMDKKTVKDSITNKDGGNKMLKGIKDKVKSILDELGLKIEPEKEKEFGEKMDELEPKEEAKEGLGEHLEMTMENLVRLLVFAGVEQGVAGEKVKAFMEQADCGISQKKDAAVDEDKDKEKEDASVDEDKDKEKEDGAVDEDKDKEKENKDKATIDAAIADAFAKGEQAGKEKAIKRFSDVMPVIKSGDFQLADVVNKSACEIKKMFIKKVLNEDIEVTDVALDRIYEIALKSKKVADVNVEPDPTSEMVKEIDKINNKEEK